jgi:CRISPR-associated protein Csb1
MTAQPFTFASFTVPNDCKRLFITAPLQPSNGDPRIQPTGFPDVGLVLYPDPSGENGQICLLESEASVANWLEAMCLDNEYEGTLIGQKCDEPGTLAGLPYLRVMKGTEFKTASTIEGHRFASEYILKAKGEFEFAMDGKKEVKTEALYEYLKNRLGAAPDGKTVPPANVPRIFEVVCELDPLALVHGFQISLKEKLTFVGLRSSRALLGSIVALGAEPVGVPGVKIDPIGTGDVGQAIFRKERITAKKTEARFTIDVGLINSMPLSSNDSICRERRALLLALSLWKVGRLISLFAGGHRLRTECDLTLDGTPKFRSNPRDKDGCDFGYGQIAAASLEDLISAAKLPAGASPKILEFQG